MRPARLEPLPEVPHERRVQSELFELGARSGRRPSAREAAHGRNPLEGRQFHLRPVDQLARHVFVEQATEESISSRAGSFSRSRQAEGEFDDTVVEQRRPHLEAHRHRSPIDLRQDVLRKIRDQIEQHVLDRSLCQTGRSRRRASA